MSQTSDESLYPKRRILSIDGGGIRGAFPAAFLAGLEENLDAPIGKYFDLIAGTSTGGILAIGLAMGISASDLLKMYETNGPNIFGKNESGPINYFSKMWNNIKHVRKNKYDSDPLRHAIHQAIGDRLIGEAGTRLLVPAWQPNVRCGYVYKTAHHPRLRTDYKRPAIDAALATAAAPTYFPRHISKDGIGLVDGGVWANNPVGMAAVEAITVLDWPRESISILSIGCLQETYYIPKNSGIGDVGLKVLNLFMDGQSFGAIGTAKLIVGDDHERKALYRVDHTVPANSFKLDDASKIEDLIGIGKTNARNEFPILEKVFFHRKAEEFVPFHPLS